MIQMKRVYEEAAEEDGRRVLVDRVWPRGVSKEKAKLEEWMKDLAPSSDLRKWFGHRAERFETFKDSYKKELSESESAQESLSKLREWAEEGTVTLVYAAKDTEHNQAIILKDEIKKSQS